jgi:hypothetical protein
MAAHEHAVARERDVALDDAGAHACASLIGFPRMLRELQRRAAMRDGKIRALDWFVFARLQLPFQRAIVHTLDEVERSRSNLDMILAPIVTVPATAALASVCVYRGDGA